jgi:hypothetical protein
MATNQKKYQLANLEDWKMKSGIKTTEFYVALVGSLLMVGVTAGFWTSAEVQSFVDALSNAAQAIAVLVATAGPIVGAIMLAWKYIAERTGLKKVAEATKK